MRQSLWILLIHILSIAFFDALYCMGYLPGGPMTIGIRTADEMYPILCRSVYVLIASYGYYHFFISEYW